MTQMDQVTQSNSAETEELSSTAQLLSVQSARLLELVGTFTLGNSRASSRGGRSHQPSPGDHPSAAMAGRAAQRSTNGEAGNPASSARNDRKQPTKTPVLVGGPAARSDDASFEAF
jgi:hypothetical protein